MPYDNVLWNSEPHGNIAHIAEHGLTPEDVEEALFHPVGHDTSRSSGRPMVYGFTPDGRYIVVVYEELDGMTLYPITAYEIDP